MGKKNKKNKGKGLEKTISKTAKKQAKKQQNNDDDDDLDNLLAQFKENDKKLTRVVISELDDDINPNGIPHARMNGSLTAVPNKNELIMYGGEFYNGQDNVTYDELLVYNIQNDTWKQIKAPGQPPPRNSHQTAFLGDHIMYVFGGEFTRGAKFKHYRDLWRFDYNNTKWEEVNFKGQGPSSRSGHRMISYKHKLYVFGGFFDNGITMKYFNTLHIYDADTNTFTEEKYSSSDNIPSPRSGFQFCLDERGGKAYLFGGVFSYEKPGRKAPISEVYNDSWCLDLNNNKWTKLKIKMPFKRSGISMISGKTNIYAFGGSNDEEEELDIKSNFCNDMYKFHLGKKNWSEIVMISSDVATEQTASKNDDDSDDLSDDSELDLMEDDNNDKDNDIKKTISYATPTPRRNAMIAIKKSTIFLFGGAFEDNKEREVQMSDFYKVDIKKKSAWQVLIEPSIETEWLGSDNDEDNDDDDDEEEGDEEEDDDEDDNEEEVMEEGKQHSSESIAQFFERSKEVWLLKAKETDEYKESTSLNDKGRKKLLRKIAFSLFQDSQ